MKLGLQQSIRALTFCLLLVISQTAWADQQLEEEFPPVEGTGQAEVLEKYRAKFEQLSTELSALQLKIPASISLKTDNFACYFDAPYFAQYRNGNQQYRFLIGRLVILNESQQELSFNPRTVKLSVDGQEYEYQPVEDYKGHATFRRQNRHYNLTELNVPESITVSPGKVASCWIVFNELDPGADTPQLDLNWKIGDRPVSLNLTLSARAQIEWRQEQIGPHGIIAVGTIHGEVNPLNLSTIINQMVDLATKKVARVIIHFDEQAPDPDPHLQQWFELASRMAGQNSTQQSTWEFPPIPSLIQELHLSNFPGNSNYYSGNLAANKHKSLNEAYVAASHGIYQTIPLKDLIEEIRAGHPLSKCSALIYGAIRLPRTFYPEIADIITHSEDPDLQKAALTALAEFPQSQSLELLHQYALDSNEELSQAALISLGSSRFPQHHQALLRMLQNEESIQQQIVKTMANFPRPLWSETLERFAREGDDEIRQEALRALDSLGHPDLRSILTEILEDEDDPLITTALEILSGQDDEQSRQLVINYALNQIRHSYPEPQSLTTITRFRVQRAIPILLPYLNEEHAHRNQVVQTLTTVGDNRIIEPLLDLYPDLNAAEQQTVLRAIATIDEGRFLKFAPEALKSNEQQNISVIISLLQGSASQDAVATLIAMIEELPDESPSKSSLIRSLGGFSNHQSRTFLTKLRDNSTEQISRSAAAALETSYSRSPLSHIYQQALSTLRSGKADLAVKQLTLVLDSDPIYPQALQARAQAYQNLSDYEAALADYLTLLKIDQKWPAAQGSTGQLLTSLSRFEEARGYLNTAIEQEPEKANWYSSRGHVYSMLEQFPEAEADYRKALKIDPDLMTALTGVALSLAINGKIDEAIEQLKQGREKHGDDSIFAYNAACTYARAMEYVVQHPGQFSPDEHKAQIDRLRDSAFEELDRSVELGYQDSKWTQDDPDLKSLQDDPRFAKFLKKMNEPKPEDAKTLGLELKP
ncbi:HEAT repeat domain-containing protein [Rubinisphaera sp.]|uniref:HEAT repeat domain-containing protein n=1 Tax=Rubinisphaera sp. TaxID=2024857 RepID=UPI0025F94996|nr:HEAT repeat domain-containing protein [Rubinisphaera sp.]